MSPLISTLTGKAGGFGGGSVPGGGGGAVVQSYLTVNEGVADGTLYSYGATTGSCAVGNDWLKGACHQTDLVLPVWATAWIRIARGPTYQAPSSAVTEEWGSVFGNKYNDNGSGTTPSVCSMNFHPSNLGTTHNGLYTHSRKASPWQQAQSSRWRPDAGTAEGLALRDKLFVDDYGNPVLDTWMFVAMYQSGGGSYVWVGHHDDESLTAVLSPSGAMSAVMPAGGAGFRFSIGGADGASDYGNRKLIFDICHMRLGQGDGGGSGMTAFFEQIWKKTPDMAEENAWLTTDGSAARVYSIWDLETDTVNQSVHANKKDLVLRSSGGAEPYFNNGGDGPPAVGAW